MVWECFKKAEAKQIANARSVKNLERIKIKRIRLKKKVKNNKI